MAEINNKELGQEIDRIFDGCYSKDLSACPKHTIFQRGKACNELVAYLRQLFPQPLDDKGLLSKIWSWGEQPCYEHLDIPVPKEMGGGFIHKEMRRRRRCRECWNKLLHEPVELIRQLNPNKEGTNDRQD